MYASYNTSSIPIFHGKSVISLNKISKHKIIAFGVSMKCIVWALVFKKEFHLNSLDNPRKIVAQGISHLETQNCPSEQ